jgi:DNA-binding IscR family transcriptional regulator
VSCVSTSAYVPCADCPSETGCQIRIVMKNVNDAISCILDHKTLAEMLRDGGSDTDGARGFPRQS